MAENRSPVHGAGEFRRIFASGGRRFPKKYMRQNSLGQAAQNVATEFIYGGPHALLSHMNMHGMGRHSDISK